MAEDTIMLFIISRWTNCNWC